MHVDPQRLRHELLAYRTALEDPDARAPLVDDALPRIVALLGLLPDAGHDARLLELGAPPFFTSLSLDCVWPGTIVHGSYAHDGGRTATQRLINVEGGPDRVYALDCFNVETDPFPYPDASFDVVVFSELIEHLAMHPMWTLAEIHRVLKPGGHVLISTPNALGLDRFWNYLHGGSMTVDRYVPLFGYGARHNREWHPRELRELLAATGFAVEAIDVRDLIPVPAWIRARRALVRLALRPFSRESRRSHIFVRARRGDVFRWRFPIRLYDHMELYRLVREPFLEMGVNDTIQCGEGWQPLEEGATGALRRLNPQAPATAWLRAPAGARQLGVQAQVDGRPLILDVAVSANGAPPSTGTLTIPPGDWADVRLPLAWQPGAGEEITVRLTAPAGTAVAVRRIWLAD